MSVVQHATFFSNEHLILLSIYIYIYISSWKKTEKKKRFFGFVNIILRDSPILSINPLNS